MSARAMDATAFAQIKGIKWTLKTNTVPDNSRAYPWKILTIGASVTKTLAKKLRFSGWRECQCTVRMRKVKGIQNYEYVGCSSCESDLTSISFLFAVSIRSFDTAKYSGFISKPIKFLLN